MGQLLVGGETRRLLPKSPWDPPQAPPHVPFPPPRRGGAVSGRACLSGRPPSHQAAIASQRFEGTSTPGGNTGPGPLSEKRRQQTVGPEAGKWLGRGRSLLTRSRSLKTNHVFDVNPFPEEPEGLGLGGRVSRTCARQEAQGRGRRCPGELSVGLQRLGCRSCLGSLDSGALAPPQAAIVLLRLPSVILDRTGCGVPLAAPGHRDTRVRVAHGWQQENSVVVFSWSAQG